MSVLVYKGDPTDNFGRYLPIPYIEKIEIHDGGHYEVHFALFLKVDDDEDVNAVKTQLARKLKYYALLVANKPTEGIDNLLSGDKNIFSYYRAASAQDSSTETTKLRYLDFFGAAGFDKITDDFYDIDGNRVIKFGFCYGCTDTEAVLEGGGSLEAVEPATWETLGPDISPSGTEEEEECDPSGTAYCTRDLHCIEDAFEHGHALTKCCPSSRCCTPKCYAKELSEWAPVSPIEPDEDDLYSFPTAVKVDPPTLPEAVETDMWDSVCDFRVFTFSSTYDYFEEEDLLDQKLEHAALFKKEISDIAYESVFIDCKLVDQLETHYFDHQHEIYGDVPLRSISGRFYKTEKTTRDNVIDYFNDLLSQHKAQDNTPLKKIKDNVAYILETYKDNVGLLVQLNMLRKVFPSKCGVDEVGRFYFRYKKRIFAMNKALQSNPQVWRRVIRNPKIFDFRTTPDVLVGADWDEDWETHPEYYLYNDSFVGRTGIYSVPPSVGSTAQVTELSEDDELSMVNVSLEYADVLTTIANLDLLRDYDAIVRDFGYFFFDYERAVRRVADINQLFSVKKLEDYGMRFPYKLFKLSMASVSRQHLEDMDPSMTGYQAGGSAAVITSEFKNRYPVSTETTTLNYTGISDYILASPGMVGTEDLAAFVYEFFAGDEALATEFLETFFVSGQENTYLIHRNFVPVESEGGWDPDYRLMCFEFQDFMDDDWGTEQIDNTYYSLSSIASGHNAKIQIEDTSVEFVDEIIEEYGQAMRGFLEYKNLAESESPLSYDLTTGMFNDFFIEGIEALYTGNIVNAPWNRAPVVFNVMRDLLYDTFGGDVNLLLEDARKTILNVNPQNGSFYVVEEFYTTMKDFYKNNWSTGADARDKLNALKLDAGNIKKFENNVPYDSAGTDAENNIYGVIYTDDLNPILALIPTTTPSEPYEAPETASVFDWETDWETS